VADERDTHQDPGADTDAGGVSRRQLFGIGAVAAGAAAAGAVINGASSAHAVPPPPTPTYPVAPAGTTLAKTLAHGTPGALGYRPVVDGPAELTVLRPDLLGDASRGSGTRTPLVAISHLTDMHIMDAQSPARAEFLDRLDDPGSPGASSIPFQSAYRPQEMLTAHVAEAMVQAINALSGAPVTGRPIDFAISTGDNADNMQYNELRWHIDLLDGRQTIRPDSGNLTKWEGVGGSDDYDTAYWHPKGTPVLGTIDKYRGTWGFPTVTGLHDNCRVPFTATGLNVPWYSCFGNHDGLVQGTVPSLGIIDVIAVSGVKVKGLPTGVDVNALIAAAAAGNTNAMAKLLTAGPAKVVKADHNRRLLNRHKTVNEHFTTHAFPGPIGHGYTAANRATGVAYYSFDPIPGGPVHGISMDTCDPYGNSDGSIDGTQFQWLQNQLIANSSRYLDTSGHWVTSSGHDKLIMMFSHHTVATMGNTLGAGRVTGDKVAALLLRFPNVVLWVNGHTHRNTVIAHSRPMSVAGGGGFWEVNTASHVDWPQQARIVELVNNGDGTLSIFGTLVDHAAAETWPNPPTQPLELAALSRELGVNDPQRDAENGTVDGKRGALTDRNVELLVKAPFAVV
jgi:metallophosphoesterase (TIGR03767 family)